MKRLQLNEKCLEDLHMKLEKLEYRAKVNLFQ